MKPRRLTYLYAGRGRSLARSIAFACLLTAVVSAQGGTDPVRLYNEAQSREATLRVELAAANAEPRLSLATRRRLRTLVGAYRDLARLFPASGIADKALWQAAMLAGDTYTTWGDPTDRSAALRAFESLTGSYPNSSLARQVPAQTRRLWEARARTPEPATAALTVPAPPAPAPAPSAAPPAPGARELLTLAAASTTPAPARDTGTPSERQSAGAAPVTRPALRPPASAPAVKTPTATTAVAAAAPPAPVVPVVPAVAEAPQTPAVTLAALMAITHERVNGAVRITLQVDRETAFHSDSLVGPPRVFVDLKNTRILERLRDAVIPVTDPVVQRIRVGRQPGNLTRVVLDLAQGHRYSAYSMYDPYRVVIDVEAPEAKATAAAETLIAPGTPAAAPKTAPAVVPAATAATTGAIALASVAAPITDRTSDTASVTAADADPVDDAPPLAPGVAASIAASVALASPTAPPLSSPSRLVAHRTTLMERRMQAKATPRQLQAGDTAAAVDAIIATRPAATAADSANGAAATADASVRIRQAPTTDLPVAGDGPAVGAPGTASKTARGDYSLSRQLGLGVARVVIDAGHGGHDPGAKVRGLTEAGLVLDIAQRLELLLRKQPGVDVIMTRRSDTYVALEERTDMANRAGADLFVSIHANASANPRARGVETYVLNFATSPEAESIAARENSGSSRTMRNLPDIVKTIALNNKVDESRELARFVQTALHNQLRKGDSTLRNLGVKQAPFMVLVGATMPAVLTEVAFVTNQDDASHMKNEKYRQDVAEALLGGITRYQQSLKRTAPSVAAQQTTP